MDNNLKYDEAALDLVKTINEMGGFTEGVKAIVKATNNSNGFSTRQSLSKQVADLTIRRTPVFDMLPRELVINPIHQWDAITAISPIPSFAGPIDSVGNDADPTITRYSEGVRYYRATTTVGQFTQAMSRPELQAQAVVDEKAIKAIMYDIEADLFSGGAAGLTVRGVDNVTNTFAPATNIVSNASAAIALDPFDQVMRSMSERGSVPTHFIMNGPDRIAFKNLFANLIRYNDPTYVKNAYGYNVQNYQSAFGDVEVMWDFFTPAKAGVTPVSTSFVIDASTIALGEPAVNGASGIAVQDLAKTGPANVKLVNYYGLLIYRNPNGLGEVTNIK